MKTLVIDANALRFCRIGTVLLLAVAVAARAKLLVALGFLIMLFPAIFSIRFAPLYALYAHVLGAAFGSRRETIDVPAVRFAQGFGASLLLISLSCLYLWHTKYAGWILAGSVALSTAFGAGGLCIGAQIYYLLRRLLRRHA
jgi:hypothetical protein